MDEKETAKKIIVEIIRQAGGVLENKTNLFKAFYYAHLKYAEMEPGYLSLWPIVRMPRGPGIDKASLLLGELTAEGVLEIDTIEKGGVEGFSFRAVKSQLEGEPLAPAAIDAIRYGVEMVKGRTAAFVSDRSHQQSRSWRETLDGKTLNIYADLIPDGEYESRMESMDRTIASIKQAFA